MADSANVPENDLRRRFEGQLSKFTNVVKGWQFRWFVLDPESGRLEYYLLEERNGRCRGSQYLAGSVVLPSDEDSHTFSVNFASGEVYKVRATHPRERQIWVDRIRACAHLHNEALASNHPPSITIREHLPPTPPGSRSHLAKNGEPSEELISLSLSAMDAFASVHDIIHKVSEKHQGIVDFIEAQPLHPAKPATDSQSTTELKSSKVDSLSCLSEELLMLKSTSQSTLMCIESALGMLQDVREGELAGPVVVRTSRPKQGSVFMPASPSKGLSSSGGGSGSRPRSADPGSST